ncbi:hypothetical protein SAMN05421678_11725 [Actinopolymorpha cephalotaxi]|uniref:Prenyltransferase and squalene oxidase repeat-containing protein n=1 Tax=Actinopolymorpha cephalotaxi TaxID=504797 RepID=A0A1I2ZTH4_9ACTN|nr:hypothetical protein [Actinopolymorpha cephalotaxi]NYH84125.1 hypothetical protein [Actinopolymorpha cephalotaxi]SFH40381.1 hypothetical protein SAMN05421678_11725 [Actinopolymorpha cephalotaxi]
MNALLFADPSPSLRWRAAVELDGAPEDDEEVRAWRTEIDRSENVRQLLVQLATARRPLNAGYLLCRLAHLGYRGPELATAVESLFTLQQPDGSWPVGFDDEDERPALSSTREPPRESAPSDGPRFVTTHTVVPLRGIAAAGFATDPRAERAYDWLESVRLPDGSWPAGPKADFGKDGRPSLPEPEYRRLTRGAGCRSATTGAVACLALHPDRNRSDTARIGVDHLLARETRDESALGWEVSRLVGLERHQGQVTFYVTFDPAFVLDLASRCGVSPEDRRVRELVAYLESLRGPYGLWPHHAHPQLSRWLTFDLECSLRRLAAGDWTGNEDPATFTPYRRGPRRY